MEHREWCPKICGHVANENKLRKGFSMTEYKENGVLRFEDMLEIKIS